MEQRQRVSAGSRPALFVERLNVAGVEASGCWVRGHRSVPRDASVLALAAASPCAPRVTRRQFDAECRHPCRYATESALACDWTEIDDGPMDGRLEEEAWRQLRLPDVDRS